MSSDVIPGKLRIELKVEDSENEQRRVGYATIAAGNVEYVVRKMLQCCVYNLAYLREKKDT